MTYGELANVKYPSMEVNLIAGDIVGNARWGYQTHEWKLVPVSDHDAKMLDNAIRRYLPVVAIIKDRLIADGLYEALCAKA